jgi:hypothetical protein
MFTVVANRRHPDAGIAAADRDFLRFSDGLVADSLAATALFCNFFEGALPPRKTGV